MGHPNKENGTNKAGRRVYLVIRTNIVHIVIPFILKKYKHK